MSLLSSSSSGASRRGTRNGARGMPTLVYVIDEYPPTTETFVWREIEAVRRTGRNVHAYALRSSEPAALRSADVWSLRSLTLSQWVRQLPILIRTFERHRREFRRLLLLPPNSASASLRQAWAILNAAALAALLREHGIRRPHLHAHFFGRTLDVLSYARILADGESHASATGHAADAADPTSPLRLRGELSELDLVVCTSESVLQAMSSRIGAPRLSAVIRTGVRERIPAEGLFATERLRLCSIGRLVEKKGFADAIRVARILRRDGVRFHWSFIGDGPLHDELRASSATLVAEGCVSWLGYLDNEVVHAHLASEVDVLVQPCRRASNGDIDGVPVVLIEAMSMGIPVVTTRISGIPELVEHGASGYVCEPGDVRAIAECLSEIWERPEAARLIGLSGREHIGTSFNDRVEAERLINAIDQAWDVDHEARSPSQVGQT
jgi:glycosyltransferase involved in cell wall biosynthesis